MELSFSAPCERNKQPILDLLTDKLAHSKTVLEIGSGTGQHAVHFARALTHIEWQPTERADQLPALQARITAEATANVNRHYPRDVLKKSSLYEVNSQEELPMPHLHRNKANPSQSRVARVRANEQNIPSDRNSEPDAKELETRQLALKP